MCERDGQDAAEAIGHVQAAADRFAGLWIAERAAVRNNFDLGAPVRQRANPLDWATIDADRAETAAELAGLAEQDDEAIRANVEEWITRAITAYSSARESPELWKKCSGKQVAAVVAGAVGLSEAEAFERQVFKLLSDGQVQAPPELTEPRDYVNGLQTAA